MTREPRRHFFNARNELHYNKEKKMGGPMHDQFVRGEEGNYRILTQEEINGYVTKDPVQETIDSLNAAIDRLDGIIKDMIKTMEKGQ